MGRGARVRNRQYDKRRIHSKDNGSDESDEDYTLEADEEFQDSEDYCSSLAEEESDESFGEYEEEEDEREDKVRKVCRSKQPNHILRRSGISIGKANKKRRVSYKEENHEDDIGDDDDDDDDDDEFVPDELAPTKKVRKVGGSKQQKTSPPRSRNGLGKAHKDRWVSYKQENDEDFKDDDFDYDDNDDGEEFTPDEFQEFVLDEFVPTKKVRKVGVSKQQKISPPRSRNGLGKSHKDRRVSFKEENDEDFKDDDFDYDNDDDDDDDEEFTIAPDELDLDFEGEMAIGRRLKKKVRKVGGSKQQKISPPRGRNKVGEAHKDRRVSYKEENDEDFKDGDFDYDDDDDDDDDDGDDDDEEFTIAPDELDLDFEGEMAIDRRLKKKVRKVRASKQQKNSPSRSRNGVGEAHNDRKVSYKEENDEDFKDDDLDYDDDEDVDDDEFTIAPDELDLDFEGEMAIGRRKKKKVGRLPLREKTLVKGQKRKRNFEVVKKRPLRKKPTQSGRLQRKSADGAFTKKGPIVKERSGKNSGPRKRRTRNMANSNSEIVSSGSSDFEYTISEEEREQLKEASEFCGDLAISLRNSSSRKRLEEGILCVQRTRPGRKGKEKIEDLKIETGKQVCRICLSEEGKKTVRGTLNCCSHYFCFACIMEWSKVESRCPLCKQRFVTISKPAKLNSGFDLRTVVVQVPERDQVYQPSEEELRGYLDPYENVICTECQQGGDDALMLLCDLCDSPAHTFCVGLGREVPEGSWYCEGCRPTALGSSHPQAPNLTPGRSAINDWIGRSSPVDNVREAIDLNREYVPETPLTQGSWLSSIFRRPGGEFQAASVSGVGVLTVSERRRIQRQIQNILNSRINELDDRATAMRASTSGINFLWSQIVQGREIAYQHASTQETLASQHTFSQRRLQGISTPSVQSTDVLPLRLSHSRGHLIQGQTSTPADGSINGMLQAGMAGIGTGVNSRSGYEELHPCNNRSSISDAGLPPYNYRDAAVPSSTMQGTLHTPF